MIFRDAKVISRANYRDKECTRGNGIYYRRYKELPETPRKGGVIINPCKPSAAGDAQELGNFYNPKRREK